MARLGTRFARFKLTNIHGPTIHFYSCIPTAWALTGISIVTPEYGKGTPAWLPGSFIATTKEAGMM